MRYLVFRVPKPVLLSDHCMIHRRILEKKNGRGSNLSQLKIRTISAFPAYDELIITVHTEERKTVPL